MYQYLIFTIIADVLPLQVLVVKTEVFGGEGGVGRIREILKEQEVTYWLPCKLHPSDIFTNIIN